MGLLHVSSARATRSTRSVLAMLPWLKTTCAAKLFLFIDKDYGYRDTALSIFPQEQRVHASHAAALLATLRQQRIPLSGEKIQEWSLYSQMRVRWSADEPLMVVVDSHTEILQIYTPECLSALIWTPSSRLEEGFAAPAVVSLGRLEKTLGHSSRPVSLRARGALERGPSEICVTEFRAC